MPPKKAAGVKPATKKPTTTAPQPKQEKLAHVTPKLTTKVAGKRPKKSQRVKQPIDEQEHEEEEEEQEQEDTPETINVPLLPQQIPQTMALGSVVEKLLQGLAHKLCSESSAIPNMIELRTILINWSEYIPYPTVRSHLFDNLKTYTALLRELYFKEYASLTIKPFENTVTNRAHTYERLQDLTYGTSSAFNHSPTSYYNYLDRLVTENTANLIPMDKTVLQTLQSNKNGEKEKYHLSFSLQFANILTLIFSPAPFTFHHNQRITMYEVQFDIAYNFILKYISYQPQLSTLISFSSIILPKITSYLNILPIDGTSQTYITLSKAITILCLFTQPHLAPDDAPTTGTTGNNTGNNFQDLNKVEISTSIPTKYAKLISKMQSEPALIAYSPPKGIEWLHLFFQQYKSSASFINNIQKDGTSSSENNDDNNSTAQRGENASNMFQLTKFRLNLTTLYTDLLLLWSSFIVVPNTLYLSAFTGATMKSMPEHNKQMSVKSLRFEHFTLLQGAEYQKTAQSIQYTPQILLSLTPYFLYISSILTPQLQPQIYLNNLLTVKLVYILSLFNHLSTALQYYTLLYQQILTNKTADLLQKYHPFYPTNVADLITMLKSSIVGIGKVLQYTTQHNSNALLPPEFQQLCSFRIRNQIKNNAKIEKKLNQEQKQSITKLFQQHKQTGILFNNIDEHVVTIKELFSSKILLSPQLINTNATPTIPLQSSLLHELLLVYIRRHFDLTLRYQRGQVKSQKDLEHLTHQERLKFTLMSSTLRHQSQWLTTMSTGSTDAGNIATLLQLDSNDNKALAGMLHYLLEDNHQAVRDAQNQEKKLELAAKGKKRGQNDMTNQETVGSEDDVDDILADKVIFGQKRIKNGDDDDDDDNLFTVDGKSSGQANNGEDELVVSLENESLFIVKKEGNLLKRFGIAADSTDDDDDDDDDGDDDDNNDDDNNKSIKNERDLLSFMQGVTDDLGEFNQYEVDDDELMGNNYRGDDGDDDFGNIDIIDAVDDDDDSSSADSQDDDDSDNDSDKPTQSKATMVNDDDFGAVTVLGAQDSTSDDDESEDDRDKNIQVDLFNHVDSIMNTVDSSSDDEEEDEQESKNQQIKAKKEAENKKKQIAKKLYLQQEARSNAFNDDLTSILQQTGQLSNTTADTAPTKGKKVITKKVITKKPIVTTKKTVTRK